MIKSVDILDDELNWIKCPCCQKKTRIKVRSDTVLINLPLYCPKCKCETLINVYNGNVKIIDKPDAKDAELINKV